MSDNPTTAGSWLSRLFGRKATPATPPAGLPLLSAREVSQAFAAAKQADGGGKPLPIALKPGVYYYCTCGRSARMPFCDGKYKGSGFDPKSLVIENHESYTATLCTCGQAPQGQPPLCAGACGEKTA